ncbi:alcohol dehydrogenase catalytic domain-containing protein [Lacticaseibacillus chiayiensis]|uniref:alcohol dehydrogenase catalytic domain-containing protein n=1 Tax=Lacticaseibacillus chiayiensis TaxID=2100821 RepID=UPI003C73DCA7
MKQIVQTDYTGITGLQIIEQPKPKISPLSALVKVKYTPVLPYDWMTEEGMLSQIRPVKLPLIVGYAFAGEVTAVGLLRDRRTTKRCQPTIH